ncbi:uncharacterized protein [Elaeis guineensis]|uniref:Uncharacterized protein LOC105046793 n=1 Tax=Elaeis guineensis var. tenera TaxID=51953 RepID=A0A6J0PK19_ELAGV|nr:uncharacterized protein LOC105046793 [Elaeis guineensis]
MPGKANSISSTAHQIPAAPAPSLLMPLPPWKAALAPSPPLPPATNTIGDISPPLCLPFLIINGKDGQDHSWGHISLQALDLSCGALDCVGWDHLCLSDHNLIINDDSAMVVTWIWRCVQDDAVHPLLRDIAILLIDCANITLRYNFRETNSAADWVVAFVAEHSNSLLWMNVGKIQG